MHEEGDHATKNQLSGSRLQGDGLEKRLEQWECILHDQHGRLLLQRLANGPLCHHHFAQFRRKEGTPPAHTRRKKAQLQKIKARSPGRSTSTMASSPNPPPSGCSTTINTRSRRGPLSS